MAGTLEGSATPDAKWSASARVDVVAGEARGGGSTLWPSTFGAATPRPLYPSPLADVPVIGPTRLWWRGTRAVAGEARATTSSSAVARLQSLVLVAMVVANSTNVF
uniref:Uncharacterized protein n=1 Tax=Oryza brachyantha TaxID=4533 RepID=J3MSS2_ORYBR